jgi:glucose-1-phosphate thymidylyltransferase
MPWSRPACPPIPVDHARAVARLTRYLDMALKSVIVPVASTAPAHGLANAALQRVANRPIVCHVLENVRLAGVLEVAILVAAQEAAAVRSCVEVDGPPGLAISYIPYEQSEGREQTQRALKQALLASARLVGDDPCLVHVAEGLLDQPLTPLLGGSRDIDPDLVVFLARRVGDSGSIGLEIRRLMRLIDAAPLKYPLEVTGAALFAPGAFCRVAGMEWWPRGTLDLVSISEQLVAGGRRLRLERVRGWRSYAGEVADLLELNRIALDASVLEHEEVPGPGNRIEGDVHVHPTACVQSSTIVGPAIVGPNALVLSSYIGPYTSIGAGVHIEGAEIERSIILPGAKVAHIGGRLVGSVVGRDARIFRDFSLPRALRLNVGDGGEVALC